MREHRLHPFPRQIWGIRFFDLLALFEWFWEAGVYCWQRCRKTAALRHDYLQVVCTPVGCRCCEFVLQNLQKPVRWDVLESFGMRL